MSPGSAYYIHRVVFFLLLESQSVTRIMVTSKCGNLLLAESHTRIYAGYPGGGSGSPIKYTNQNVSFPSVSIEVRSLPSQAGFEHRPPG